MPSLYPHFWPNRTPCHSQNRPSSPWPVPSHLHGMLFLPFFSCQIAGVKRSQGAEYFVVVVGFLWQGAPNLHLFQVLGVFFWREDIILHSHRTNSCTFWLTAYRAHLMQLLLVLHISDHRKQILPYGRLEGYVPTLPFSLRLYLWSKSYSSFQALLKCFLLWEASTVQPSRIKTDLHRALCILCSNSLFMRLFACKDCEHLVVHLCQEEYLTHNMDLLNISSWAFGEEKST